MSQSQLSRFLQQNSVKNDFCRAIGLSDKRTVGQSD